jgi:hypothetical protein
MISVDLPPPDTPVTQVKSAERNFGGDVLQVVAARADDLEQLAVRPCARLPARRSACGRRDIAGEAGRVGHDLFRRALGDDFAAMDAGAGAHVDHMVGGADRVLVVLDHDHGVAEVAQALQRFEQAVVVALVQADGGLVEHIEHAGQAGADLRGQADALALAARQRAGGARQRQIVEPDIVEEAQPLADFLQDARAISFCFGELFGRSLEPGARARIDRSVTSPMCGRRS